MPKPKQQPKTAPKAAGVILWDGKQLVFDLENVEVADAVTMTAHAERPVLDIFNGVASLDPLCQQAFLWWLLRINGHPADIASLNFNMFALLKAFNAALGGRETPAVEVPKDEPTPD